MIRKILSVVGAGAIAAIAACGGGTTAETPQVLVPATRTVPVYEEVDVETPEVVTPDTVETPEVESPDVEYEIDIDD